MRAFNRNRIAHQSPVSVKLGSTTGTPTDASGHTWDANRYQVLASGEPRLSSKGNYYLQNGAIHAD